MPRLTPITEREQLPEENRDVFDYLIKTRGRVSPAFGALLYSPDLIGRIAHTGTYVRFESTLPDQLRELAALAASTEIGNTFERSIHTRFCADHGVDQALIDAVASGAPVDAFPPEDTLAVRTARELLRDHQLSLATFEEARSRLGDQGVIDLIGNIGYYVMLGCLHVGFGITEDSV